MEDQWGGVLVRQFPVLPYTARVYQKKEKLSKPKDITSKPKDVKEYLQKNPDAILAGADPGSLEQATCRSDRFQTGKEGFTFSTTKAPVDAAGRHGLKLDNSPKQGTLAAELSTSLPVRFCRLAVPYAFQACAGAKGKEGGGGTSWGQWHSVQARSKDGAWDLCCISKAGCAALFSPFSD